MSVLPAESLDFLVIHAVHSEGGQRFAHLVENTGPDDDFNLFHDAGLLTNGGTTGCSRVPDVRSNRGR